jgi:hypothetical protein
MKTMGILPRTIVDDRWWIIPTLVFLAIVPKPPFDEGTSAVIYAIAFGPAIAAAVGVFITTHARTQKWAALKHGHKIGVMLVRGVIFAYEVALGLIVTWALCEWARTPSASYYEPYAGVLTATIVLCEAYRRMLPKRKRAKGDDGES